MSPKTRPTKPIDIYVRVSKVAGRGGDSFISPDVQEERCRAQLAADGLEAGELYVELDQSGRKSSRPLFDQAIARVHSGESGGIIVYRLSRFGRSTKDVLEGVKELEAAGAVLISCHEKLDTSTPMGRFALTIFAALNELESEQIKENWTVAQGEAVRRGVQIARAPFGYRKTDGSNGKPKGTLVPDPETAHLVTEVFQRRARGAKLEDLAAFLQEQAPKPNGKAWVAVMVGKLLRTETYLGHVTMGDHRHENAHEPLVDEETWWRCRSRESRYQGKGSGPGKGTHPLSGYVRCSGCGYRMARSSTKLGGKTYWYVRCKNDACKSKAGISELQLEALVYGTLAEQATAFMEKPRESGALLEAARARVSEAEAKLESFEATWLAQGLDPSDAIAMRKPLVEERDAAREALAEIPVEDADTAWIKLAQAGSPLVGISDEQYRKLLARARAQTRKAYEEGLSGDKLLNRLMLPVSDFQNEYPEFAAKLLAIQQDLVRQTLRSVTVTGKKGSPEGRVEVELLTA